MVEKKNDVVYNKRNGLLLRSIGGKNKQLTPFLETVQNKNIINSTEKIHKDEKKTTITTGTTRSSRLNLLLPPNDTLPLNISPKNIQNKMKNLQIR